MEQARLAGQAAGDKKAQEIVVLGVTELTTLCDYFVICSGTSTLQVRAIADGIEERLGQAGVALRHKEGYNEGRWVLLDFGDLVVHIFITEDRRYYNIERLWGDAPRLEESLLSGAATSS